jgi:von Willebrand factor type D domain
MRYVVTYLGNENGEGSGPTMNPGTFKGVLARRIGRSRALSVAVAGVVLLGLVLSPGASAATDAASDSGASPTTCAAAEQAASSAEAATRADTAKLAAAQAALAKYRQELNHDEAAVDADQKTINDYNHLEQQENTAVDKLQEDINDFLNELPKAAVNKTFATAVEQAIEAFQEANKNALVGLGEIESVVVSGDWATVTTTIQTVEVELTAEVRAGATLVELYERFTPIFAWVEFAPFIVGLGYLLPAAIAVGYLGHELDNAAPGYHTASNEITDDEALEQADLNDIQAEQAVIEGIEAQQATDQAAFETATAQVTALCYSTPAPLPGPGGGSGASGGSGGLTWGDPHLITFDGATYNFQQVGEFVLTKSTTDDFEIQVRQQPWDGSSCTVAENSAFAFHIGGHTVSVYVANPGLTTLVDGSPVTLGTTAAYSLPGGGTITNDPADSQETIAWPTGSTATVNYGGGFYLTLSIQVSASEKGHLEGLLGTDAGDAANDLTTSTGTVLPYPAIASDTSTLYGTFANGWRLTSADSLFTYPSGQSTSTFTNTAFPCQEEDLGSLTASQIASATATCQAAGVSQEPFLDACILDVAATGDNSVATADGQAESTAEGTSPPTGTQSITLASGNGTIGALDPNVTVEDSCAGTTTQATIVAPDPGEWASPITGSQWDSVNSGLNGCNETFTTTFTLPAGAVDPQLTVTDLADNSANVSVNDSQPFLTGNVAGSCETDFNGSPMTGSTTSGLVTGVNTLTFDVDNCYPADGESPTGVDFTATVTYSTSAT